MKFYASLLVGLCSILGFVCSAEAQSVTVTKAVQDACAWEYNKSATNMESVASSSICVSARTLTI